MIDITSHKHIKALAIKRYKSRIKIGGVKLFICSECHEEKFDYYSCENEKGKCLSCCKDGCLDGLMEKYENVVGEEVRAVIPKVMVGKI